MDWLKSFFSSIVGWLGGKLGGWLLSLLIGGVKTLLTAIEKKWPATATLIDQILKLLGEGVPAAEISAHLATFKAGNLAKI